LASRASPSCRHHPGQCFSRQNEVGPARTPAAVALPCAGNLAAFPSHMCISGPSCSQAADWAARALGHRRRRRGARPRSATSILALSTPWRESWLLRSGLDGLLHSKYSGTRRLFEGRTLSHYCRMLLENCTGTHFIVNLEMGSSGRSTRTKTHSIISQMDVPRTLC
jgi:hypothetical protein